MQSEALAAFDSLNWTIKMMNFTVGTTVSVQLRAIDELEISNKSPEMSLNQYLTCQILPVP